MLLASIGYQICFYCSRNKPKNWMQKFWKMIKNSECYICSIQNPVSKFRHNIITTSLSEIMERCLFTRRDTKVFFSCSLFPPSSLPPGLFRQNIRWQRVERTLHRGELAASCFRKWPKLEHRFFLTTQFWGRDLSQRPFTFLWLPNFGLYFRYNEGSMSGL